VTRRQASRTILAAFLALSAALAYAADSASERTSMPESCSNRDVNCVLYDGPPRRVIVGGAANAASPAPGAPAYFGTSKPPIEGVTGSSRTDGMTIRGSIGMGVSTGATPVRRH
jgi:hypothetical protein